MTKYFQLVFFSVIFSGFFTKVQAGGESQRFMVALMISLIQMMTSSL
jgi:hypothetical protein